MAWGAETATQEEFTCLQINCLGINLRDVSISKCPLSPQTARGNSFPRSWTLSATIHARGPRSPASGSVKPEAEFPERGTRVQGGRASRTRHEAHTGPRGPGSPACGIVIGAGPGHPGPWTEVENASCPLHSLNCERNENYFPCINFIFKQSYENWAEKAGTAGSLQGGLPKQDSEDMPALPHVLSGPLGNAGVWVWPRLRGLS